MADKKKIAKIKSSPTQPRTPEMESRIAAHRGKAAASGKKYSYAYERPVDDPAYAANPDSGYAAPVRVTPGGYGDTPEEIANTALKSGDLRYDYTGSADDGYPYLGAFYRNTDPNVKLGEYSVNSHGLHVPVNQLESIEDAEGVAKYLIATHGRDGAYRGRDLEGLAGELFAHKGQQFLDLFDSSINETIADVEPSAAEGGSDSRYDILTKIAHGMKAAARVPSVVTPGMMPIGTRQDIKGGRTVRADLEGGNAEPVDSVNREEPLPPAAGRQTSMNGARVVINPSTFKNKKDALCVAFNERFRIAMEQYGFEPQSEPTEAQRKFFADTAYADDEVQLRRTILARILTLDTSVKDPTQEQLEEALSFLRTFEEREKPSNDWEANSLQRLARLVETAAQPMPAQPKEKA